MSAKERKELIILVVGVVALMASIWYVNRKPKTGPSFPTPAEVTGVPLAEAPLTAGQKGTIQEDVKTGPVSEIKYSGRQFRDPLDNSAIIGAVVVKEEVPEEKTEVVFPKDNFLVSAVIWGSKRPQAIINDKIWNIGDVVEGAQIVAIDKKGVHLSFKGQEIVLPIK